MPDLDYQYTVLSSSLEPFGPAVKENMDITRLLFDFSCWVDQSQNEVITLVQFPTIEALPYGTQPVTWSVDYPVTCPASPPTTPPEDTYPLMVVDEAITTGSTTVEIKVIAGTPGFSYDLAFLVTGSVTGRRKQIDVIITVEQPSNTAMVGPGDLGPNITAPIIITDTTALPMGFAGLVILNNSAAVTGIVVTLPPNPTNGQMVKFIDALGTDATHPVTFRGDSNQPVDGDGSTYFVSIIAYDVLEWNWTGHNWHLQSDRATFLG